MTLAKFGTAAALIIALAGPAGAMPLTGAGAPQRPAAQIETVQWGYGGGYGHGHDRSYERGHHYGWRHHGPRCWTERIVHRTPWGPRVDYRRVCR